MSKKEEKLLNKKRLAILGSTGSIGTSTLEIAARYHTEIEVCALAAKSNIDKLEIQAKQFSPKLIAVFDPEKAAELQKRLPHIAIVSGLEGLNEVATYHAANFVMSAMTGSIGIVPTARAIESGKDIGLANKEVLVAAGEYITKLAKKHNVALLPVDSELCALFQCLNNEDINSVNRLILTASGGPFREYPAEKLYAMTAEEAVIHPTWHMGAKVSIDCSTLINKGFEVMEAYWLFNVPIEKIDVVVHPQSKIHSMVEYCDGAILAQIYEPDMKVPILYSLTYPERLPGFSAPFDFTKAQSLEFFPPDYDKFFCLKLAFDALKMGGSAPCYLNAINEVLVERFIDKEITWGDIGASIAKLMAQHDVKKDLTLDAILDIDRQARIAAAQI